MERAVCLVSPVYEGQTRPLLPCCNGMMLVTYIKRSNVTDPPPPPRPFLGKGGADKHARVCRFCLFFIFFLLVVVVGCPCLHSIIKTIKTTCWLQRFTDSNTSSFPNQPIMSTHARPNSVNQQTAGRAARQRKSKNKTHTHKDRHLSILFFFFFFPGSPPHLLHPHTHPLFKRSAKKAAFHPPTHPPSLSFPLLLLFSSPPSPPTHPPFLSHSHRYRYSLQ